MHDQVAARAVAARHDPSLARLLGLCGAAVITVGRYASTSAADEQWQKEEAARRMRCSGLDSRVEKREEGRRSL